MIKQIILSANNDSMGDISETEAQQFRNWAESELKAEYPDAEVEVVSEQQNNVVLVDEDSFEADQVKGEAFNFIDRLWDRCPWSGEHFE